MGSPSLSRQVLRFGVFELDREIQQLRRAGVLLRIQPQPFKVLAALASRPGEVVTRKELRHELWGNETFVDFEKGLNYCVRQIRAVLNDDAQTPRYIETIPRRGYRFIAAVEGAGESQRSVVGLDVSSRQKGPLGRSAGLILTGTVLILILIGGTIFIVRGRSSRRLSSKDTVVLSDFENKTGEPAFDDVLKQALAIQLEQSPLLNILSDDRVRKTTQMMNRSGERLSPEVTREVCVRTSSKAMLTGTIAGVGSHYLLGLRAVDCQTGDTLASTEQEAENRDQILYAVQKVGNQMREQLGESLASVHRYDKPLPEVTTSSLEALKAYTQGTALADESQGIPYLREAIKLDPNFARAYIALGTRYANTNQLSLAIDNLKKGYERRERVSERERIYIETVYYMLVTGELDKANQSYMELLGEYPNDGGANGNLAFNYAVMGSYEKAAQFTETALRLDPEFEIWNGNLEGDYLGMGRLNDAKAVFEKAEARGVDGIDLRLFRYYLAFLQEDDGKMQEQVAWASGKPGTEDWFFSAESDTAAYYGRLSRADDFSRRAVESAVQSGAPETAAGWLANAALRSAEFGDTISARRQASQALALSSGLGVRILVALAYARSGDQVHAQRLAHALTQEYPANTLLQGYWLPTIRASLALNHRNAAHAVELLRPAFPYEFAETWQFQFGTMYPVYVRGLAYLRAGQAEEASAQFQKMFDHRSLTVNFPLASLAYLQYGRARAMCHDEHRARKAYEDFFSLWKGADPNIPVLKQAQAEYAKLS